MKIKTNVEADGMDLNHNQTTANVDLPVKTKVKAGYHGGGGNNHNQTTAKPGLQWPKLANELTEAI
jgi:hypothetical protein